jgi:predicted RNA binding protein YcfA (HicA-like mRNA interferase family)
MPTFPEEVPKTKTIEILERLSFRLVREGPHLVMVRKNPDGMQTSLTMPNHSYIKGSTLRTICTQAGIAKDEFLKAYEET